MMRTENEEIRRRGKSEMSIGRLTVKLTVVAVRVDGAERGSWGWHRERGGAGRGQE